MRKLLLTIVLLGSFAPLAAAGPWYLGVRGGSSIPNLHDNGGNELSSGWSTRVAPYFGVSAEVPISGAFSLATEIAYMAQGGKRDGMQPVPFDLSGLGVPPGTALYANFDNTAKLDYIEVPLLARYSFGGPRRLYVDAGPYAGYLLSAKTVTSGQSPIYLDPGGTQQVAPAQDFGATTDNKVDLHNFNWGFRGGVGVEQPIGSGWLNLEVCGELGLADIQKDTAANGKNTTGTLAIALGYTMRLGAAR